MWEQGFGTLAKDVEKGSEEWERWCGLEASEKAKMPGEWGKQAPFRHLLIIRALKPDRITNALQNFCESIMGSRYVNQVQRPGSCISPNMLCFASACSDQLLE